MTVHQIMSCERIISCVPYAVKASAIENAKKYLELNPNADDKEDVEEFLEDLNKEEKEEPTKVLKG